MANRLTQDQAACLVHLAGKTAPIACSEPELAAYKSLGRRGLAAVDGSGWVATPAGREWVWTADADRRRKRFDGETEFQLALVSHALARMAALAPQPHSTGHLKTLADIEADIQDGIECIRRDPDYKPSPMPVETSVYRAIVENSPKMAGKYCEIIPLDRMTKDA